MDILNTVKSALGGGGKQNEKRIMQN